MTSETAAVIKPGDACKLLNICKTTLYKLIDNEELPVIKIPTSGKRSERYMYRFSREDLLAWLTQKKENTNVQSDHRNGSNGVGTAIQGKRSGNGGTR